MISGLEFSKQCQWVIDPRYPDRPHFQSWIARDKDWIFINGDYLQVFAPTMRTKRYVFVIHNTDRSFGQQELDRLLPYAYHIFAINTTVRHPKLTTIPLGFVDRQLPLLQTYQNTQPIRDIEIYANFTQSTNSEKRKACIDAFKNNPDVVFRTGLSVPEYLQDLSRSKFVLCPEGTGMDTHRVYESLLCGAIPVVLRNPLSHLYEKLPVCILSSWSDPLYVPTGTFSMHCASYLTGDVSK
jgi:hypothetical protein